MSVQHIPPPTNLRADHGQDNRMDVLDARVTDKQRRLAESVGMIVHHTALRDSGDTWLLRATKPFRELHDVAIQLCPDERFRDEPMVQADTEGRSFWSCCLVHRKAVLTCAHGFEKDNLREYRVVFGHRTLQGGGVRLHIPKADVHEIEDYFDRYHYSEHNLELGADWALLLLKEPSQRPLLLVAEPPPEAAEPGNVYAIGHPHTLPMKVCQDGYVKPTCIPHVFAAPLDTDDGNSGSPIFCGDEVIGVLIERQEDTPDYAWTTREHGAKCYKRQRYGLAGRKIVCTGADGSKYTTSVVGQLCTSASSFLPKLEELRATYP
jgi:hypothetical protein